MAELQAHLQARGVRGEAAVLAIVRSSIARPPCLVVREVVVKAAPAIVP